MSPSQGFSSLSVAFTKEDSAETASETMLPDRPVSPHPNHVTEAGLKALELQLARAREAYEAAQKIEDINNAAGRAPFRCGMHAISQHGCGPRRLSPTRPRPTR